MANHEPVGYDPDDPPRGMTCPAVDFEMIDNQDSGARGGRVTAETVKNDYTKKKRVRVYPVLIPADEVPNPILAEEEIREKCDSCAGTGDDPDDEDETCYFCQGTGELQSSYDWSDLEMSRGRAVPPAKILVDKQGVLHILDGNHRITFWNNQGYDLIPAWVIDERPKRPRK